MAVPAELLRSLPSVDRLLADPGLEDALARWPRPVVAEAAREVLLALRGELRAGRLEPSAAAARVAALPAAVAAAAAAALAPSLVPVINATGVVIHTNLGRAPWAERVAEQALAAARGYCNLEYDLAGGERGTREQHLGAARRLLGAEAVLAVNNCAAAILLVLDALARGREVIVARGELVEIGGSFRIPEILERGGARLVEVGTTNRTRPADYERAIGPETALLLKVHPSNFRIVGFSASVSTAELAALARTRGVTFVEDLGSGNLVDLAPLGIRDEPTVGACLAAGADLVTVSGDKLLGGPQAGIVAGRASLVERLRKSPLYRALRPDKVTLAALEELFLLYLARDPWAEVPVLRALAASPALGEERCRRLAGRLAGLGFATAIASGDLTVGGGAAPLSALPGPVVAVRHETLSAATIEERLRRARPPVVARVEDDRVVVDLRTVAESEEEALAAAFAGAIRQ